MAWGIHYNEVLIWSRSARDVIDVGTQGVAVVVHPYKGTSEEELTLLPGEKVYIHSKDEAVVGDFGWWLGRIGQRTGVFPLNFVVEGELLEGDVLPRNESVEPITMRGSKAADKPAAPPATSPLAATVAVLREIPFGDLVLERTIGRGGFGLVYCATFQRETVAVKLIESTMMSPSEIQRKSQELRSEGELLAGCAHRNVARLLGACTAGPFCLVMEFARGGALSTALREVQLTPKVIIDWATQIACGMNYLHNESPVSVHCDLKSANVLLSLVEPDGSVKLTGNTLKITDFGLARKFTQTTYLTEIAGTFQWMAPEVIKSNLFTKRSDVWSFGVVVWELLTGQVPYHGVHPMSVAYGVALHGSTLPLPSSCPEPFDAVLSQCWKLEARIRPSFQELLAQLRSASVTAFGPRPYSELQEKWKKEIAEKLSQLNHTEQPQEITYQRETLLKLQQEQLAKKEELDQQERSLALRERDLQLRELALRLQHTPEKPTPVKRTKFFFRRKKVTISSVGAPMDFRHLEHVGADLSSTPPRLTVMPILASPGSPPLVKRSESVSTARPSMLGFRTRSYTATVDLKNGSVPAEQRSSLPTSRRESTETVGSWVCGACQNQNPASSDRCKLCALPLPSPVKPSPPPRLNIPVRTQSANVPLSPSNPFLASEDTPDTPETPEFARLFEATDISPPESGFLKSSSAAPVLQRTESKSSPRPESHGWIQLHLTFEEATRHLQTAPDGTFLIRRSHSSLNSYAIAVVQERGGVKMVWHGLIDTAPTGTLYFRDQPMSQFATLEDLVQHFSKVPYAVDSKGVGHTLRRPDDLKKKRNPKFF